MVQKSGPIVTQVADESIKTPLSPYRKVLPYISLEKPKTAEPTAFAVLLYPDTNGMGQPVLESLPVKNGADGVRDTEAIGVRVRRSTSDDLLAMAVAPVSRQYGDAKEGLTTDGEAAYVRRNGGRVTEAGLVRGSYLEHHGQRLIETTPDITSVYVRFSGQEIEVNAEGTGAIKVLADKGAKVVFNGKAATTKVKRGYITLQTGAAGPIVLTEPSYATDAAAIQRALAVPRPLAYKDMVAIRWQSSVPADAILEYRKEGAAAWIRSINPQPLTGHLFVLSNLEDAASYRLRITCRGEDGAIAKKEVIYTHKSPKADAKPKADVSTAITG